MSELFIAVAIVYLCIVVAVFLVQTVVIRDSDQSNKPWKTIITQSFQWPIILIKIIFRR
jgi:hypothetical protein